MICMEDYDYLRRPIIPRIPRMSSYYYTTDVVLLLYHGCRPIPLGMAAILVVLRVTILQHSMFSIAKYLQYFFRFAIKYCSICNTLNHPPRFTKPFGKVLQSICKTFRQMQCCNISMCYIVFKYCKYLRPSMYSVQYTERSNIHCHFYVAYNIRNKYYAYSSDNNA